MLAALPQIAIEAVQLVGGLYETAIDLERPHQALSNLVQYVEAVFARLLTFNLVTGALLFSEAYGSLAGSLDTSEINRWSLVDPLVLAVAALPPGQARRCHLALDHQRVGSEPFYRDFYRPHGLRWSMAGVFRGSPGTVNIVALSRAAEAPPFGEAEEAALGHLLPHFERAAALRKRLELQSAHAQMAADAWKALPMPCFLTDRAGRCIDANDAFHRALEPLALRLAMGRARFASGVQTRWEAALFQADVTALTQTLSFTTAAGKPWTVHLLPWVGASEAGDGRLMLAVFEEPQSRATATMPAFSAITDAGLTRAEVEVLSGLLKGWPAKVIASHRSASVNTVRSQIMAILEKTGFKSQKELMASFGNSVSQDPSSSEFASSLLPRQWGDDPAHAGTGRA